MAILNDVKNSLHISNTANDGDITGVIDACKIDLKLSGIVTVDDTDALTKQAIKLYARGYFNYQGDGERWQKAYDGLKNSMALCGDYNTVVVTV